MRLRAVLCLLVFLPACGDAPIVEVDLSLAITPDAVEVRPGEPFDLHVVRIWKKGLRPEAFPDHALEPLDVKLLASERREDGSRVEETLHYRAAALSLGDVSVPAPVFRARLPAGTEVRTVSGNPVIVKVVRALDPADPGEAEFPDGPFGGEASPLIPAVLLLLAGIGLVTFLRARRRSQREVAPALQPSGPETPLAPAPHEVALGCLSRLQGVVPKGRDEMAAQHEEASRILRDYLLAGLGVRAGEMTTEECLASPKVETARAALVKSLSPCDLVKFAARFPLEEQRGRMLTAAVSFVRQTSSREEGR